MLQYNGNDSYEFYSTIDNRTVHLHKSEIQCLAKEVIEKFPDIGMCDDECEAKENMESENLMFAEFLAKIGLTEDEITEVAMTGECERLKKQREEEYE